MEVYYNQKKMSVTDDITLKELVELNEDLTHKAVWLNNKHIPLSEFESIHLKPNDHIKVIRIRGGG
ncbi:MAG: sulfur carrier protein ThiS [Clostridia bacterium]|nr:sulfur carrier protein ThiS [Clostridia bacterium]